MNTSAERSRHSSILLLEDITPKTTTRRATQIFLLEKVIDFCIRSVVGQLNSYEEFRALNRLSQGVHDGKCHEKYTVPSSRGVDHYHVH